MPPLIIFGRKWPLGTDDFVFPTFIDLVIRVVRVTFATIWLWKSEFLFPCLGAIYSTIFFLGFCGIFHLIIIVNLILMYNSGKGGIMDVEARKVVPSCLVIRLILQILETIWTSLGTFWLYAEMYDCQNENASIVEHIEGAIKANWIFIGIFVFLFILNYLGSNSLQNGPHKTHTDKHDSNFNISQLSEEIKSWEKLVKNFFCFMCSRKKSLLKNGFSEIGRIFSYVFTNCGLVLSDIVVGLNLVTIKQKNERQESGHLSEGLAIRTEEDIANILPSFEAWNSISKINHFFKYSTAIHLLTAIYFQKNSCNILKTQLKYIAKCLCCKQHKFILKGDCCCFCKTSSVTSYLRSALPEKDTVLVHLSFKNCYYRSPFMVLIDHSTKSIVISVRGTLSREDIFTDMCGTSVSMAGIPGIPKHFKCHSGFLQAGLRLKHELDNLNLINQLKSTFTTYSLVTTGNSLGASIAILLAMMYRPKYPEVKCFGYATPSFLSLEASEYCKDFVQTIIYGHDMVARISIHSMKNLMHEMQIALYECKTPKFRIQLQMMLKTFRLKKKISIETQSLRQGGSNLTIDTNISVISDTVIPVEQTYGTSYKYILPSSSSPVYLNSLSSNILNRSQLCPLYPAGQILYITPSKHFKEGRGKLISSHGPRWNIKWANPTEFNRLIVRSRMIMDHQPARTLKSLSYFNSLVNAAQLDIK